MAIIKAFRGIRPDANLAAKVAALPYDVVDSDEARHIADGNEFSFFHISKPEIDMNPDINPYDPSVYAAGRENLRRFVTEGIMKKDPEPKLYLYSQEMDGRIQTGLVACASIDDYIENRIKKHELTREEKEKDRTVHLDTVGANTGPVFLFYREDGSKKELFAKAMRIDPEYDFTADDGIRHTFRLVSDAEMISAFIKSFQNEVLYIADGHHRAASAVKVGQMRREAKPDYTGDEEFNSFLSVIFPHSDLKILAYNRAVKDLNGRTKEEFLRSVSASFDIQEGGPKEPKNRGEVSMYMNGKWYTLKPTFEISEDPVEGLDVMMLQTKVLSPVLGIDNPRKDSRIKFIGGIRGTAELERLVDAGKFAVAFSMFPTSIEELIDVADAGKIMPPKSTWFEPKLRSGLIVHDISE